jgi:hypothetical protein
MIDNSQFINLIGIYAKHRSLCEESGRPAAVLRRGYLPAILPRAAAAISTVARAPLRLRPSFVYVQRPSIEVFAVEPIDRGIPFRFNAHLDECESPGLSRVTVRNDIYPIDRAIWFEEGTNRSFGRAET